MEKFSSDKEFRKLMNALGLTEEKTPKHQWDDMKKAFLAGLLTANINTLKASDKFNPQEYSEFYSAMMNDIREEIINVILEGLNIKIVSFTEDDKEDILKELIPDLFNPSKN